MKINDADFGELEFNNYDWIGYKNIDFFGNEVKVTLIVREKMMVILRKNNIRHITF